MSTMPPSGNQQPFDPLSPMASDFDYDSGAAYSTPDPFIRQEPDGNGPNKGLDFENPTGNGSLDSLNLGTSTPQSSAPPQELSPYGPAAGTSSPWAVNNSAPPPTPYVQPYGAYQPGPYMSYGMVQKVNPLCLSGMILSMISFVLCFFSFIASIPAIILGIIGLTQINKDPQQYRGTGIGITAIVLGAISLLLALPFLIFLW